MPRPLTPRASIRCDEGSTLPAARQWGSRLAIWTRAGGDKSRQLPAAGRGVSAEASCRNRPLFGRQVGGCVRTAGRSLDERGSRFYRRGHRCERSHGGGVELSAQCRPSSAVSTVLMRLPSCNHSRRDAPARGRPALEPGWRQLRASGRRREPAGNAAPAAREAATVRPRKPGFLAAGVAHRRADAHKSTNAQVSILRAEAPGGRDKPGRAAPPFLRERQPPGWLISSPLVTTGRRAAPRRLTCADRARRHSHTAATGLFRGVCRGDGARARDAALSRAWPGALSTSRRPTGERGRRARPSRAGWLPRAQAVRPPRGRVPSRGSGPRRSSVLGPRLR